MKKSKILIPALAIAGVGATIAPMMAMTSCHGSEEPSIGKVVTKEEAMANYIIAYAKYSSTTYTKGSASGNITVDGKSGPISNQTFSYNTTLLPGLSIALIVGDHKTGQVYEPVGGLPWTGIETFMAAAEAAAGAGYKTEYRIDNGKTQGIVKTSSGTTIFNVVVDENGYMTYKKVGKEFEATIGEAQSILYVCELKYSYSK